ncbi:MAG: GIY-YIG nuclease family protein [Candidatus Andersenbacteria bacterium]
MTSKSFFVYILRCSDDTLYTGWSTDVEKRVHNHNAGKGAKYTRARLPVVCVYSKSFASKEEAMKREYEIKQMTREDKLALSSRTCSAQHSLGDVGIRGPRVCR